MNYQIGKERKTIKLNVGDVISDDKLKTSCTVQSIGDDIIHISTLKSYHPYLLTVFALNLRNMARESMGVKKIKIVSNSGSVTVNSSASEVDLYHQLVELTHN